MIIVSTTAGYPFTSLALQGIIVEFKEALTGKVERLCPLCSREFSAVTAFCDECTQFANDIRNGVTEPEGVEEEFRELELYPGYSVSNFGDVRSNKSNVIMKSREDPKGLKVTLKSGGKKYTPYIHRLVAQNFLDDFDKGLRVEHKNGNRSDNRHTNLAMSTIRIFTGKREQ